MSRAVTVTKNSPNSQETICNSVKKKKKLQSEKKREGGEKEWYK